MPSAAAGRQRVGLPLRIGGRPMPPDDPTPTHRPRDEPPHPAVEEAVRLAADVLAASQSRETAADRAYESQMARLLADPAGKRFTIAMADEVLRIRRPARAARRLEDLLAAHGTPCYLPWADRRLLQAAAWAAGYLPDVVMPQVTARIRADASRVIVPAEPGPLAAHLARRHAQGMRVTVNRLGEAILGEAEAARRLAGCLESLADPAVDCLSVKLSAIASQISLTGYRHTIDLLAARLRPLYRRARRADAPGAKAALVTLDMEEYRDLHLTVDVFRTVLDEPEFLDLEAGIVLQAYLPDSAVIQRDLTDWAIARRARGGAGIKLRLVKGANLAMERVEAEIRGWPQAPYESKLESDANFKRMLAYGCRPRHAAAVRLGVASHNLFDIARALRLREREGVADRVEFEMLEGMADPQALELAARAGGLLLYTPIVKADDFESAVAYLVRRLDENTAAGSFLGALFDLRVGSLSWQDQADAFAAACRLSESPDLPDAPRRWQDRSREAFAPHHFARFANVPDTDFSLPVNRAWIDGVLARWSRFHETPPTLPLVIGGAERSGAEREGFDPSRPGVVPYRYVVGDATDVDRAVASAAAATTGWAALGVEGRGRILRTAAAEMANRRGDTIGAMLLDAGKAVSEADPEVSEAIDFASYYAGSLEDAAWHDGTTAEPLGVVVVAPPWNFPYAIAAGGCLAALAAGNAVILKPAPQSVLVAWALAEQLWAAGVPRDVLQFLPLDDGDAGRRLVTHAGVAGVILTGGYETAELFRTWKPDIRLFAETSGKNATIVTAAADLDLAVRDIVRGAFGHSGQKCSATSLAILEGDVYDDPRFLATLREAAASLVVDSAWNPSATVTPLIRPPEEALVRGLTRLDPGETWLLEPRPSPDNPRLWSPGIRLGVAVGGWFHRTECFGPVLGLMRAADLDAAIDLANDSAFGLTAGIQSLDDAEVARWRERIAAGNAYVNRGTTGAIVRRQPFGGWKRSSVGPGAKAGGPNYVGQLCHWRETGLPSGAAPLPPRVRRLLDTVPTRTCFADPDRPRDRALAGETPATRLAAIAGSAARHWEREFGLPHDPSRLACESNRFHYRPRAALLVRIADPSDLPPEDLPALVLLAATAGVPVMVSLGAPAGWGDRLGRWCGSTIAIEDAEDVCTRLPRGCPGPTIRTIGRVEPQIVAAAAAQDCPLVARPLVANARIELLTLLAEQSISETLHRYGNPRPPSDASSNPHGIRPGTATRRSIA
jgi:RHH-type proline utilization regulon transcriptional repressor/proline dehydrogenase/delta 1-pyrroline-5-carboxylate dehydrogenase